jgi:hypothetical protein
VSTRIDTGNNTGRGNIMNIDVTEIIALFAQLAGPAIDVFLAVWAIEHAYQLVLWVLRKVPLLGIK